MGNRYVEAQLLALFISDLPLASDQLPYQLVEVLRMSVKIEVDDGIVATHEGRVFFAFRSEEVKGDLQP